MSFRGFESRLQMNDNLPIIVSVAQIIFKIFMYITFKIFVFNKNESPGRIVTKPVPTPTRTHTHIYIYSYIYISHIYREREKINKYISYNNNSIKYYNNNNRNNNNNKNKKIKGVQLIWGLWTWILGFF